MTEEQAKNLLVQTMVIHNNYTKDTGIVTDVGKFAFYVEWDDGQHGWISYHDAKSVSVYRSITLPVIPNPANMALHIADILESDGLIINKSMRERIAEVISFYI